MDEDEHMIIRACPSVPGLVSLTIPGDELAPGFKTTRRLYLTAEHQAGLERCLASARAEAEGLDGTSP